MTWFIVRHIHYNARQLAAVGVRRVRVLISCFIDFSSYLMNQCSCSFFVMTPFRMVLVNPGHMLVVQNHDVLVDKGNSSFLQFSRSNPAITRCILSAQFTSKTTNVANNFSDAWDTHYSSWVFPTLSMVTAPSPGSIQTDHIVPWAVYLDL
jgi:hypothetical protein